MFTDVSELYHPRRGAAARRAKARKLDWFVDLSRVFDKQPERICVDSCHYADLADGKLAEKVADFLETREGRLLKARAASQ